MLETLLYILGGSLLVLCLILYLTRRENAGGTRPLPTAPPPQEELIRHAQQAAAGQSLGRSVRDHGFARRLGRAQRILRQSWTPLARDDATAGMDLLRESRAILTQRLESLAQRRRTLGRIRLPTLLDGEACRVAMVTEDYVAVTGGVLEASSLEAYLSAYQQRLPLTLEELDVLPDYLLLALMERTVERVQEAARTAREWEDADAAAQRLSQGADPARTLSNVLAGAVRSPAFWERLSSHMMEDGGAVREMLPHLDQYLLRRGLILSQLNSLEHQRRSVHQIVSSHLLDSLRTHLLWGELLESLSAVDARLRQDPAGIYPRMDAASRGQYRAWVSQRARACHTSQIYLTDRILTACRDPRTDPRFRHVGAYLEPDGRRALYTLMGRGAPPSPGRRLAAYLATAGLTALVLAAAVLAAGGAPVLWIPVAAGLIPLFATGQALVQGPWMRTHPASLLPRLDLRAGIPPEGRTLVVIPALLTQPQRGVELLRQLEDFHLAHREKEVFYLLLADFASAPEPVLASDRAIAEAACAEAMRLERTYGQGRFGVVFRSRRYNPRTGDYMGHERKRGALEALMAWLTQGEKGDFFTLQSTLLRPEGVRFVMTLDADTQLLPQSLPLFVGTLLHPLNQAEVNGGRVTRGYGILSPRVEPTYRSTRATAFAGIFGGRGGLDAYPGTASSLYQDLFARGIFTGKGLIDVAAYTQVLLGVLPENRILSHDLLEGSYLRAANPPDLVVLDSFPSTIAAYASREHRWVRGDWQLIPWLGRRSPAPAGTVPNPLPALCRWQILDNLLRSLCPVCAMLSLCAGALAGHWAAGLAISAAPLLAGGLAALVKDWLRPETRTQAWVRHRGALLRGLAEWVLLPYSAAYHLDAILRTLWRLASGHGNLLEWTPAAELERGKPRSLGGYAKAMLPAALWLLPLLAASVLYAAAGPLGTAAVLLGAPYLAFRLSQPPVHEAFSPDAADLRLLRGIARRTYRYFQRFAGPEDHYLPPDHYQHKPFHGAASRTSPTNIGYALLAWCAGRQLGYDTAGGMLERLEHTLDTMEGLPRWKGHFFNWYDTRTLEVLPPRYISTVDSGNLMASLLGASQWILQTLTLPPLGQSARQGMEDTLRLHLRRHASAQGIALLQRLERRPAGTALAALVEELRRYLKTQRGRWAAGLLTHLQTLLSEYRPLLELSAALSMAGYADASQDVLSLSLLELTEDPAYTLSELPDEGLLAQAEEVRRWAQALCARTRRLSRRLEAMARSMDFTPLYDPARELFSIGRDMDREENTPSHYDLMASEARGSSFLAIVTGQVSARHWERLGRPLTPLPGGQALISWSGTMFEYLMPAQFFRHEAGSLLGESVKQAIREQIRFAEAEGIPWGISESGYYAFDRQLHYQYYAFGVPTLAMKPTAAQDRVVAPYATVMALPYAPQKALQNLRRLVSMDMLGEYGFLEAADFTAARLREEESFRRVESVMAHHQGMALMGLVNYLEDGALLRAMEAVPDVRAHALLLQEREPLPGTAAHRPVLPALSRPSVPPRMTREFRNWEGTWLPQPHWLGDGDLHLAITPTGAGRTWYRDWVVERDAVDPIAQDTGIAITLTDSLDGQVYSATRLGSPVPPTAYQVRFAPHQAVFARQDGALHTTLRVAVSPDSSLQARILTVENRSAAPRELRVTVYFPLALDTQAAYEAHPAYRNLFVETAWDASGQVLTAVRRQREPGETTPCMACRLLSPQGRLDEIHVDTHRARILGREGAPPFQVDDRLPLEARTGAVLDPAVCMQTTLRLPALEKRELAFIMAVGTDPAAMAREAALCSWNQAAGTLPELAWIHQQSILQSLGITARQMRLYHAMAPYLFFPELAPVSRVWTGPASKEALWSAGISGDVPLVVLRIASPDDLDAARHLVRGHAWWRIKGVAPDLVLLDDSASGYRDELSGQLTRLVRMSSEFDQLDVPRGIHVRSRRNLSQPAWDALLAYAVCVLDAHENLTAQLMHARASLPDAGRPVPGRTSVPRIPLPSYPKADDNGWGGFSADGKNYIITLGPGKQTPAPWSNVLTGDGFGALVTAEGGGMTWQGNSQSHRLTPWSNDPVLDPPGSCVYLRDEETGAYWTIPSRPADGGGPHQVLHTQGMTTYQYGGFGLYQTQEVWVHPRLPMRFDHLTLVNSGPTPRNLTVTAYARWVLGAGLGLETGLLDTGIALEGSAIWAQSPSDPSAGYAYLAIPDAECEYTADRGEFLGRMGSLAHPAAMEASSLSRSLGPGLGGCGVLRAPLRVPARGRAECTVILGWAPSLESMREQLTPLISRRRVLSVKRQVLTYWEENLATLTVETPDSSLNWMVNRWAPCQVEQSRFRGRLGFYQCGGAIGFRDQLQDCLALLYRHPEQVRGHILRCAAHQFQAGDVQHWWHEPRLGVRTHMSDDLLFLPWVTARYVEHTGDASILEEPAPFLENVDIPPDREDWFGSPPVSKETGSVLEHCLRAIARVRERTGPHGLPLIGTGDWNDAMNSLGDKGRGESVWLGFFLCHVMNTMLPLLRRRGMTQEAEDFQQAVDQYAAALEAHGWDGDWYRRAFSDTGAPVGSRQSDACRIDCLSQAWAAIAGVTDPRRARRAMEAMEAHLLRETPDPGMLLLLDPPFVESALEPGYIQGYVAGVRENGGQYTHAALWAVWGWAALGESDRALDLLRRINPPCHGDTPEKQAVYKVEPYVVAADVYGNPAHLGRGGWTWYTGSASWLMVVTLRELLGLRFHGNLLELLPRLPQAWPEARVELRHGAGRYHILLRHGESSALFLDGAPLPGRTVPLSSEPGDHTVEYVLA